MNKLMRGLILAVFGLVLTLNVNNGFSMTKEQQEAFEGEQIVLSPTKDITDKIVENKNGTFIIFQKEGQKPAKALFYKIKKARLLTLLNQNTVFHFTPIEFYPDGSVKTLIFQISNNN